MSGLGIMAVDPGGKTGVAFGIFNTEMDGVGNAFRRARSRKAFWVRELSGSPEAQGWWLARAWQEFQFRCNIELLLPIDDILLAIEQFELRQKHVDLAPVRVTHCFTTLLQSQRDIAACVGKKTDEPMSKLVCKDGTSIGEPVYQTASMAMTYATNDRLRQWGAWVRGSEHARDATRHLALALSGRLT